MHLSYQNNETVYVLYVPLLITASRPNLKPKQTLEADPGFVRNVSTVGLLYIGSWGFFLWICMFS